MLKGIIMNITGREAVLLTKDSNFVRVLLPEGQYDLGQEIVVENRKDIPANKWVLLGGRRWGAIAAILIVAIVLPVIANTIFFDSAVHAYVTLDINPSTEFSLNRHDKIVGTHPLNDQGTIVLEGAKLKGRGIEYGIEYFLTKAYELGYSTVNGEGAVIATTIMEEGENAELEQKILQTLDKTIEKNQLPVKAGVLSATKQIKEEAEKVGISAGKYLIALQASDDHLDIDMEDVKNSSIGSAISKAGGNLEGIMNRARKNNEELAKLLENNRDKLKNNNGNKAIDSNSNDNNGRGNSGNDNNGKDNNGRDNSDRGNNGNDNNGRDNSDRGNNGNDNNGRDNSDRGNNGNDNNGMDNSDKDKNRDRRGKPGIIDDIIMQLFD